MGDYPECIGKLNLTTEWDPTIMERVSPKVIRAYNQLYRFCPRCYYWLHEATFFTYNDGSRRWSSYCNTCRREYYKEWAAKHRQPRDQEYRYKLHDEILELLGNVCQTCGEGRRQVLDVHHKDMAEARTQRKAKWNKKRKWRHAIRFPERYKLLCKNCHYLEHHPNNLPN